MESKLIRKTDNEAKKSCKVVTLGDKINIADKLCRSVSAIVVGLTFR
jgi:hypothetical protein